MSIARLTPAPCNFSIRLHGHISRLKASFDDPNSPSHGIFRPPSRWFCTSRGMHDGQRWNFQATDPDCEGAVGTGPPSRVFSANIRPKTMPTPSMTARRTAHPMALFRAALAPPRTASAPPVKKPLTMAFHGSSFFLHEPLVGNMSTGHTLPEPPNSTVKGGEETAPNTKVPTENGCSGLDGDQGVETAFTVGGIATWIRCEFLAIWLARVQLVGTHRKPLMPCQMAPPMALRG